MFLRKSDLEPELLTLPNTFPAHFEPLPDGDAILVLDIANQAAS